MQVQGPSWAERTLEAIYHSVVLPAMHAPCRVVVLTWGTLPAWEETGGSTLCPLLV